MRLPDYSYYKNILKDQKLPLAFLDIDLFERNISDIASRANGLPIRIASKSLRCIKVLRHILKNKAFDGIMAFTGSEANYLIEQGFDDILMGYPICEIEEIKQLCTHSKQGKKIVLMTDSVYHFQMINDIAKKLNVIQPVCIDVDMSMDLPGLHFGVLRSPITSVQAFKNLVDNHKDFPNIKIVGIMGYEAQIAGLGDNVEGKVLMNNIIKILKQKSIKELSKRRALCVQYLQSIGIEPTLVNGGGTGSIESTHNESWVTEVTVGSGFYSPALFDNYSDFKHLPALAYALRIVRSPQKNYFTALGGGYIASGSVGIDKQPKPYLPSNIKLTENEGTGEVQTPFKYIGKENLAIGDPVFFRHAKAGELCERFQNLTILKDGKIIDNWNTYRGDNQCFL